MSGNYLEYTKYIKYDTILKYIKDTNWGTCSTYCYNCHVILTPANYTQEQIDKYEKILKYMDEIKWDCNMAKKLDDNNSSDDDDSCSQDDSQCEMFLGYIAQRKWMCYKCKDVNVCCHCSEKNEK